MRAPVAFLLVSVTLASTLAGCGSARIRKERLERELDAFVYPKPLDAVWQEARRLLAERGYPLAGKDADAVGQRPMSWAQRVFSPARETGPAQEQGLVQRMGVAEAAARSAQTLDTGWNPYSERYHLEGWPEGAGSRVVFTRVKLDLPDRRTDESRDLDMELALLRRVDPAGAARVEAAVEAAVAR